MLDTIFGISLFCIVFFLEDLAILAYPHSFIHNFTPVGSVMIICFESCFQCNQIPHRRF